MALCFNRSASSPRAMLAALVLSAFLMPGQAAAQLTTTTSTILPTTTSTEPTQTTTSTEGTTTNTVTTPPVITDPSPNPFETTTDTSNTTATNTTATTPTDTTATTEATTSSTETTAVTTATSSTSTSTESTTSSTVLMQKYTPYLRLTTAYNAVESGENFRFYIQATYDPLTDTTLPTPSAAPTGTVTIQYQDGGCTATLSPESGSQGQLISSGFCEVIPTTEGNIVATANYGGDAVYGPGQATVSFTVTPKTLPPVEGAPANPSLSLDTASDTGSSNNDRITNDDTPTLRVRLTNSGPNAHVVGDVVRVYLGTSNQIGSITLTAANITAGEAQVTTTTLGDDGQKTLTAKVFRGSTSSGFSAPLPVVLDKTAPVWDSGFIKGSTVQLAYTEQGSGLASTPPAPSLFALLIDGRTNVTPASATINQVNNTVTLNLSSPVTPQNSVTLTYTSAPNGVRDIAGNLVASGTARGLVNRTSEPKIIIDEPPPTTQPPNPPVTVKPPPNSKVIVTDVTQAQPTTINSSAARFNSPTGIARDKQGNLYITDQKNATVRKIAVSGAVTTVAGKAGETGNQDGPLGTSRFLSPGAIAVDSAGNLYVVDNRNLRKIDTSGTVSTLVKTPDNATVGSANTFGLPTGLAVDSTGNIFVADYLAGAIWKVTADGTVSRFVAIGEGISNLAGAGPSGIAIDTANNLYVSDLPYSLNAGGFSSIHKVTQSGTVTLLHGPTLGLVNARGIGIDTKGDLYVNENLLIVKIAVAGGTTTTYQLPTTQEEGSVSAASVAVNPESGVVYFTDAAKHTVNQMSVDGKISIIAGRNGESGAVDIEK